MKPDKQDLGAAAHVFATFVHYLCLIPGRGGEGFSLHHPVQTDSEAHTVACPMCREGSLSEGKTARA